MANSIDAILAIEKANRQNVITDIVRSLGQARGYDRYILFAASSSYERIVKQIYWIGGDWFDDGSEATATRNMQVCPVTRHPLHLSEPFFWTKQYNDRGERYRIVRHEPHRECRRLRILAVIGDLKYGKRKQGKEAHRDAIFR